LLPDCPVPERGRPPPPGPHDDASICAMLAGPHRTREIGVRLPAPHEMTPTSTPDHGIEVWSCNQCTRRLLIRRPPDFQKTVLEPGDEQAAHVGGTGGLRMTGVTAQPTQPRQLPAADRQWLAEHGIGWEHPQS